MAAENGGHRYETELRHCRAMYNKFVFSRVHWLQMWHCPHLLLSAVLRRRATAALLPATGLYQS